MMFAPQLMNRSEELERGGFYTIATLGSHSALQILKGAHDEGFRTLATHGIDKPIDADPIRPFDPHHERQIVAGQQHDAIAGPVGSQPVDQSRGGWPIHAGDPP